ncbi:hypothetical protein KAFR_0A08500 [Kazachstania africana CBS 2517]|uniref:Uncharacterized protein n=1 Tax=Kazachstania africana (strain ATCC 22294 / BCRC 22015 / CBS 2517 / CECT 1963 / NBRC 1671 / NRRL Y-8276) TaxID=1071382 RepID=H2API4_KAZAF|nr:hypothetical protein KAFR_0A08500 [Kazachstania africana CBS 2517]CCF56284.1 hypothetical protein KAFR_0A08500 [Kazachstania africana CBS 2517]
MPSSFATGVMLLRGNLRVTLPISSFLGHRIVIRRNYSSLDPNVLEAKYKEKLLARAKKEGLETIDQLKEHLKEEIQEKKKKLNEIDAFKQLDRINRIDKIKVNSLAFNSHETTLQSNVNLSKAFKTLDSYLKVEKAKKLSKQEIEYLWRAQWSKKSMSVSAVIPAEIFDRMINNVNEDRSFILPVFRNSSVGESGPKKEKVEMHYVQWAFAGPNTVHCLVTPLAEYKLHEEFARPHLIIEFFTDLSKDKDIVLMKGTIESGSNISVNDAQFLILNIQRFYGAMGSQSKIAKRRLELRRAFTKGSKDFTVDELIALSQSMKS